MDLRLELIAHLYLQVAVIIGELIGRYANDWIMNRGIRTNKGIFEAEVRLWCVFHIVE